MMRMMKADRMLAIVLLASLVALPAGPAFAAGGSPTEEREFSVPDDQPMSLEEQAEVHYNSGLKLRDRAWKLEAKVAAEDNAKKREKLEKKAMAAYERATKEFAYAIQKNPEFYQAYSSLGYALRKRGMYEDALRAYDGALELNPEYAEAIEYRAEAYLGLGEIEKAKEAYHALVASDRERADELLTAMKRWVEVRRTDPGAVSAQVVEELASWIEQRDQVAAVLGSGAAGNRAW